MTILPIVLMAAAVLLVAYFTYGRQVMRWLGIDPCRQTPAVEMADGNDYVPAPAGVVLGGHFTAIAAAGPIVGPIVAGLWFGWVPALLWILIGAIFIGAVHDSGALFVSLRHRAASITQVVREQMSRPAYLTFLLFVWICLVYVVIAFADLTAGTFARLDQIQADVNGVQQTFVINGGAVVVGATGYLFFSVLMGLAMRYTRVHWAVLLTLSVAALFAVIWKAPEIAQSLSANGLSFLDLSARDKADLGILQKRWDQVLLLYCFVASVIPMWLLLQPRGVIGASFLYAALAFGLAGTLIGGWSSDGGLAIQWPAFREFNSSKLGMLFPFLFITIACGACSGFHSIVASGTTCKQTRSEADIRPIGYGAMLLEAMVAVFSLSCVMVLSPDAKVGAPDAVYARGLGRFMELCGISLQFAIGFGLLAFSSFVFDTMDVCTRLGRYVMQELIGVRGLLGGVLATFMTLAGPGAYLWLSEPGRFLDFWRLFGTSNQLLAALTLVGVSVWLRRSGRSTLFVVLPAAFMIATTLTALGFNLTRFITQYRTDHSTVAAMNIGISALLIAMSLHVVWDAIRTWMKSAVPTSQQVTPALGR